MEQNWKCTVCGYLHRGDEPPSQCPRCGADHSQFIELKKEKTNLLHDMVETFILHPVVVHFPNGLLPTALLFLLLALLTGNSFFEHTAFHLVVVALCIIPIAMTAGIYDWSTKFHGTRAKIFYKKIALASLLFFLSLSAVILHGENPTVYALLVLATLPVVVLLGHYGAKLVYRWEKKDL